MASPNVLYKAYAKMGLDIAHELIFSGASDKEFRRFCEERFREAEAFKLSASDIQVVAGMEDKDLQDLGCNILLTKEGKRIAELPSYIRNMVEPGVIWDTGTIEITDEEFGKREFTISGIALDGENAF